MFLDDKLLEICRNADCSSTDKIEILEKVLMLECEAYYKSLLHPSISKTELKVILDETFDYWDSFTVKAIKEGGTMKLIGELSQIFTFKYVFLSNKELADVYNNL